MSSNFPQAGGERELLQPREYKVPSYFPFLYTTTTPKPAAISFLAPREFHNFPRTLNFILTNLFAYNARIQF